MSAYKVKNGGIILEYGFNPVTKVYGYTLTDLALKRVILKSNTQSGLTNIELAEKMRTFNAPKEHILRVLTNKPI